MNILIKQNNREKLKYFELSLKEFGHNVNILESFDFIENLEDISTYDILILDIGAKKLENLEIASYIRNNFPHIGIVFISDSTDLDMKIRAFQSGADDFIDTSISIVEILARLKSIYNRCNRENIINTIEVGDLILNYDTREAKREDKNIVLTTKEFLLLEYFMKNKNILLTRNLIKEHIWGIDFTSDTNIVDVYVTKLRNKIDRGFEKKLLRTIRGAGYILKN